MEEARKQANLRLLQRTCSPHLTDILATATHAVLYEFDTALQNWKKCQTEGSLFLAANANNKEYSLVILNRNSTDNFQLPIQSNLQLQHQEPYLILRLVDDKILGIWFHNADERVAMHRVLQATVQTLREQPPPESTSVVRSASAPHPVASGSGSAPSNNNTTNSAASMDATERAMAAVSLKSVLGIGTDTTTMESSHPAAAATAAPPPQSTPHPPIPAGASASGGGTGTTTTTSPITLDKKSLQLALLSLIQDDRFLDLLHSQYLRVARSRAKKEQEQQQNGGAKNHHHHHP